MIDIGLIVLSTVAFYVLVAFVVASFFTKSIEDDNDAARYAFLWPHHFGVFLLGAPSNFFMFAVRKIREWRKS